MTPHRWRRWALQGVSNGVQYFRVVCDECGIEVVSEDLPPDVTQWRDLSDDCDETKVAIIHED